eukprot:GHRQ01032957.1.p1 GENE.GHRQ01032957.1~~GHRQ01032957.1.p1  ORF type:complete len:222 (+),score=54.21 GHRQ01032957.1:955-1620(+)
MLPADEPQQQAQLLALPHFAQHQQQAVQQLAGLQALQAVRRGSTGNTNSSSTGRIQLSTAFLESTLRRCRATKTAAEVGCLLEASRGSSAAHKAMWAACKPGMKEFQLEAVFTHAAGQAGLMQLGYPCIVGAGRNAAILHYERNSATVRPNDLVLVDAGGPCSSCCAVSESCCSRRQELLLNAAQRAEASLPINAPCTAAHMTQLCTRMLLIRPAPYALLV